MSSEDEKYQNILKNNTYFLRFPEYEEKYEKVLKSIMNELLELNTKIQDQGLTKEIVLDFISNNKGGFQMILALTGLSRETLLRIITIVRVVDDPKLNKLVNKSFWPIASSDGEWSIKRIEKLVSTNQEFSKGMVNLLFEGSTIPIIKKILPLFELKKLDIKKIDFSTESLLDTILRYKFKGSSKAEKENNSEIMIKNILEKMRVKYTAGTIGRIERDIDFIIPNKEHPEILIEVSFQTTTASAMGDKAKTETKISEVIKQDYPNCNFIGFIDGMGVVCSKIRS